MHIAVFSTKPHDVTYLNQANEAAGSPHELAFFESRLRPESVGLLQDPDAVCVFVNDEISADVITALAARDIRLLLTRSAGFNHIDVAAATRAGITVARVPAYSPHAVAEHTLALLLALNRKLHRAYARVREQNFALAGLEGFDVHGTTVGIVGTGTIGRTFARLMRGFDCELLAFDPYPDATLEEVGVTYVPLEELISRSRIVSLHCPLTPETHHLFDAEAFAQIPRGALLVNTSRGGLVDASAAIDALKTGQLGGLAIDVYEEEADLFFEDHSEEVLTDDVFVRLLGFPNVLVTAHQAFFTTEALITIAETTIANADAFASGAGTLHAVEA